MSLTSRSNRSLSSAAKADLTLAAVRTSKSDDRSSLAIVDSVSALSSTSRTL